MIIYCLLNQNKEFTVSFLFLETDLLFIKMHFPAVYVLQLCGIVPEFSLSTDGFVLRVLGGIQCFQLLTQVNYCFLPFQMKLKMQIYCGGPMF